MNKEDKVEISKDFQVPLCVDLDGALSRTNLLLEAFFCLIKQNPFMLFRLTFWFFLDRAKFREKIFSNAKLSVDLVPWNYELIDWLREQKGQGRNLILLTGPCRLIADQVSDYFGFFDEVISHEDCALKGQAKSKFLCDRFGIRQFAYIGQSMIDLYIWQQARSSVIVSSSAKINKYALTSSNVEKQLPGPGNPLRLVFKAIRVHQWPKNWLLFLPMILMHYYDNWEVAYSVLIGVLAFTLTSSSVYIVNDLLDLESDRRHPDKRNRPFASGRLSMSWGLVLAPSLLVIGMVFGSLVSADFLGVLLFYYLTTVVYSFWLKKVALIDVLVLAHLYTWRIFAGVVAIDEVFSTWLFMFAGFFFLSLALIKRYSELILTKENRKAANSRRGYAVEDIPQLVSFGTSSGYMSVLVLALYFHSDEVRILYHRPDLLWLTCPLLLYWISHMWLQAHRGYMHSDPLIYAMKDKLSYLVMFSVLTVWLFSSVM
ncbi:MAG: hypothetical protein CMP10_05545 [Zetaproteobacteria bacterium]|mgnify:CR=1 FL=1|nr:hypothetical protein [Pseudobdellovibrionaceae bacterium]